MLLQLARVWEVEAACVRGSPFLSDARLIADAFVPSLHAAIARQCHRLSSVVHAHFRAAFVATAALCTRLSLPHHATARVLKQWDIRSYATLRRNEIASDVESVLAGSEPAVLSLDTKQRTFSSPKSFLLCLPPPPPSFSWLPFSSSSSPCPPRFPPFFPHAQPHTVQPTPPPFFFQQPLGVCIHSSAVLPIGRCDRCARVCGGACGRVERRRLSPANTCHCVVAHSSGSLPALCLYGWYLCLSMMVSAVVKLLLVCCVFNLQLSATLLVSVTCTHSISTVLPCPLPTHTHTLSLSLIPPPLHLSTSPPLHLSTSPPLPFATRTSDCDATRGARALALGLK